MKHTRFTSLIGLMCLLAGLGIIPIRPAQAVPFTPPDGNTAPRQGSGGASRGSFIPPQDNVAPRQGSGGASRGNFTFTPTRDHASPHQASGGASRGFTFTPSRDSAAPRQASGGASRGNLSFIPPPDQAAPLQTSGGASRGGFIPDPDQAAPRTTAGGASRTNQYGTSASTFQGSAASMLAVTPQSFYGLTLAERPTLMAYLPASSAEQAIFTLKDEAQNVVYQQNVPISGEEGILAIQLPESAPALEIDRNYQWYVTLQTEADLTPASPFVDAWIKRVAPTPELSAALAAEPLVAAEKLAEAGIWYDTSAILAGLQSDPSVSHETLMTHWSELLSSVGLVDLIDMSLLSAVPAYSVN